MSQIFDLLTLDVNILKTLVMMVFLFGLAKVAATVAGYHNIFIIVTIKRNRT